MIKKMHTFLKKIKVKLNTSKNNNLNSVKILGNFHGNISLKNKKRSLKDVENHLGILVMML